jgi:16S rRNA (guanine527-N7)-methyltransferase
LLDSTRKKTAFLEAVVAELGLTEVKVLTGRAEDIAHVRECREAYDVVLSRAVAPLATLAEYCLPFVRLNGRMIAQKTADISDEMRAAGPAIAKLGGTISDTRTVRLPGLQRDRLLVVVIKVKATPKEYPRRAGLAARQPLGQ